MTTRRGRCLCDRPIRRARAFSLIELVIVVLIMATVSAIAIPRMTRAADGADAAAMWADVQVLNKAIDMYRFEHSSYPVAAKIARQLTLYTNAAGTASGTTPDAANGVILGPYVLKVPPLPLGPNKDATGIAATAADGIGWIYDTADYTIIPNLVDGSGDIPDYVIEKLNLTASKAAAMKAIATGDVPGGATGGATGG